MSVEIKKVLLIITTIVVLLIVIFLIYTFFPSDEKENNIHYLTYKEFHDKYEANQIEAGDILNLRDTFSDLWYNQTAHYTYMTFKSMDNYRTDPNGYDAGLPEDITDDYKAGDKVELKIEMTLETNEQGVKNLIGHITSIKHLD